MAPSFTPSPRWIAATALIALPLWRCPFAALLGVPCPGCGLTRACWALLQGEWGRAIQLHPLAPLVMVLVAVAGVALIAPRVRALPAAMPERVQTGLLWGGCALVLGVWLVRFAGALGGPVPVQALLGR